MNPVRFFKKKKKNKLSVLLMIIFICERKNRKCKAKR